MSIPQEKLAQNGQASRFPKRLAALLALYAAASVCGLWTNQAVLFCVLTLMMVLAVIGRQKSALLMLRGYTLVQLLLFCFLPVLLQLSDKIQAMASSINLGPIEINLSNYLVLFFLLVLSALQVWIAFNRDVKQYFNRKMNMNIMV